MFSATLSFANTVRVCIDVWVHISHFFRLLLSISWVSNFFFKLKNEVQVPKDSGEIIKSGEWQPFILQSLRGLTWKGEGRSGISANVTVTCKSKGQRRQGSGSIFYRIITAIISVIIQLPCFCNIYIRSVCAHVQEKWVQHVYCVLFIYKWHNPTFLPSFLCQKKNVLREA